MEYKKKKLKKKNCLFCKIISDNNDKKFFMENKNAIVIFDKFPLSEGHSLLISRRHFKDISLADKKTWSDFLPLLKKTLKELKKIFSPKGFNIISNIGKEAYQSIFHIHIHIIPKYEKEKGFIWN